jgi:hypothetical protein
LFGPALKIFRLQQIHVLRHGALSGRLAGGSATGLSATDAQGDWPVMWHSTPDEPGSASRTARSAPWRAFSSALVRDAPAGRLGAAIALVGSIPIRALGRAKWQEARPLLSRGFLGHGRRCGKRVPAGHEENSARRIGSSLGTSETRHALIQRGASGSMPMTRYRDYTEWDSTRERREEDPARNETTNPFDDPEVRRRMAELISRAATASTPGK